MLKSFTGLYFDRWAARYEEDVRSYGYDVHEVLFKAVAPYIGKMGDDPAILDCGIGTGLCSGRFKAAGYGNITGVDVSQKMLALCRQKKIARTLYQAKVTALETLPLQKASFDIILAGGLMEFLSSPGDFFALLTDYLAPGGVIACTHETLKSVEIYRSGFFSGLIGRDDHCATFRRRGKVMGVPYFYKKYLYDPAFICGQAEHAGLAVLQKGLFEAYRWDERRVVEYQWLVLGHNKGL